MSDEIQIATWSPCCGFLRKGVFEEGAMHSGLCRGVFGGKLGPTIRLVPHPDDATRVEQILSPEVES